jgi:hypothetical protein
MKILKNGARLVTTPEEAEQFMQGFDPAAGLSARAMDALRRGGSVRIQTARSSSPSKPRKPVKKRAQAKSAKPSKRRSKTPKWLEKLFREGKYPKRMW